MISATRIPLGRSLEDGSEVSLTPENGPLLVFGRPGKSVVVKKLLKRAAEAGLGPIFAYDESAAVRYPALVRVLNASGPSAGVFEHVQLVADDRPTGVGPGNVVVSDGLGGAPRAYRERRNARLDEVLRRRVSGGPPPHFFADGLDVFLGATASAGELAGHIFGHSRSLGTLAVGSVDGARDFLSGEPGRLLLGASGSVLLLRMPPEEAGAVLAGLHPLGAGVEHLDATGLCRRDGGSGVFYDKARSTAAPVRIDLTDAEAELFETDPARWRRLWGRRA